jgi:hypothetical protein
MSETKHSPEPWTWDEGPWGPVSGRVRMGDPGRVFDVSAIDARRIVACVNSCAGIPTDALERGELRRAMDVLTEVISRNPVDVLSLVEIIDAVKALRALGRLK